MSTKIKNKKIIDKIGKTPVVILPLKEYESMKEELELLNSKMLVSVIANARQEVEKGEVYSINEVRRKLMLDK